MDYRKLIDCFSTKESDHNENRDLFLVMPGWNRVMPWFLTLPAR